MGHVNQFFYAKHYVKGSPKAVLEVGSKDYGNTAPFRSLFSADRYVGLDMEAGDGVDVVHDLTEGLGPLEAHGFDLILCVSVLEHVRKPWVMAQHLSNLLAPDGQLYLAVPFVWRKHNYPDDYFRFTWRGIEELFPDLAWRDFLYSGTAKGKFYPCVDGSDNERAVMHEGEKYLPYLETHGIGVCRAAL